MSKPVKPLWGLRPTQGFGQGGFQTEGLTSEKWLARIWLNFLSIAVFVQNSENLCASFLEKKKHGEQHSVILSENQIPVRGVKGPSRPHRQWQISWRYIGSEGFRILERGFLEVRKRICQISWQKILYISEQRLFRRPDLVMEHKAWKNLWVYLQCIWPGILNSSKQREIHLVRRHYGLSPSFSLLIWRGKRSWPLASPLVLVSWPLLQALTTLRNFNGRLKQWWFCSRDTRNACLNCCCCCCYCCCCCCCCWCVNYSKGLASCKWSSRGACLLQMIILRA